MVPKSEDVEMKVQDVMKRGVVTCASSQSLGHAARIMWEQDCGSVPVVDEAGRVVAMLTDRDICMATFHDDQTPWCIGVLRAASTNVRVVRETDTLEVAEAVMRNQQVHRVPVVDAANRPVGILSTTDLVREARAGGEGAAGLDPESVVRVLGAVCAPRRHSPPHTP
jgi:CBS domain-containing protein